MNQLFPGKSGVLSLLYAAVASLPSSSSSSSTSGARRYGRSRAHGRDIGRRGTDGRRGRTGKDINGGDAENIRRVKWSFGQKERERSLSLQRVAEGEETGEVKKTAA